MDIKKRADELLPDTEHCKTDEAFEAMLTLSREVRDAARLIAWEYARGIRKLSGTSAQQGDDIARAIEEAIKL